MKLTWCRTHQVENMLRQTSRVESLFSLRQRFAPGPLSIDIFRYAKLVEWKVCFRYAKGLRQAHCLKTYCSYIALDVAPCERYVAYFPGWKVSQLHTECQGLIKFCALKIEINVRTKMTMEIARGRGPIMIF